jgi:hypothetical protein
MIVGNAPISIAPGRDLGAVPARGFFFAPAGERSGVVHVIRHDGHIAASLNARVSHFAAINPDLAGKALMIGGHLGEAIDPMVEEGIEVCDLGPKDLEVSGGLALGPTIQRRPLLGDRLACSLGPESPGVRARKRKERREEEDRSSQSRKHLESPSAKSAGQDSKRIVPSIITSQR